MGELFKIIKLTNKDKIGNLKTEAHSKVKSTKYFPIYTIDDKKMIFKPLSKTKPFTTPFFAYSEVYWSYIIKKYFEHQTPRYYLAISEEIEREQPKYFKQGVLVESITSNNEELINLYDYFNEHPESLVDIKNYTNYCMKNYDYTKILLSDFIKNNRDIGENLSNQILLSILRQDQNFHYENINFIIKGESLLLAPPIDFEFSTPFLFPDKPNNYKYEKEKYLNTITIKYEDDETTKILKKIDKDINYNNYITNNICLIVKLYPDIVLKFIKNLEQLINDLPSIIINDPNNYIGPLNSDYWKVGHAYFKDKDLKKYEDLQEKIILENIDKNLIFNNISLDILNFCKSFNLILKTYLLSYYNGIEDLENLTIKQLLNKLNIIEEGTIENIDIDTKKIKLKQMTMDKKI